MDNQLEKIAKKLQADFGASVEEFRGEAHLTFPARRIVATLEACRDQFGFELLDGLTAVDYWPKESPRFHIVYLLTSVTKNLSLTIRVPVNGDQLEVPTACGVYASANWREREVWDMFGIRFEGHPDPRRILLPPESDFHPLSKDYPLGYEEPQFTFNFDEIRLAKPGPKE